MHDDRLQQKAALQPHYDIAKLAFYAGLCVDIPACVTLRPIRLCSSGGISSVMVYLFASA
jgi:hypothetical protein